MFALLEGGSTGVHLAEIPHRGMTAYPERNYRNPVCPKNSQRYIIFRQGLLWTSKERGRTALYERNDRRVKLLQDQWR